MNLYTKDVTFRNVVRLIIIVKIVNALDVLEVNNDDFLHKSYMKPVYQTEEATFRHLENSPTDSDNNDDEIKTFLEEKYRFINDEESKRFKISQDQRAGGGKNALIDTNIAFI